MLSASCPACGCPLFEVKGETLCVVCAEEKAGKDAPQEVVPAAGAASPTPAVSSTIASPGLAEALEETVIALCARIRDEKDPRCVAVLMEAVVTGIEGLGALRPR